MKRHLISPPDRDELARLAIDGTDTAGIDRIVTKVSLLPPQAIYEVERLIGRLPHVFPRRQSWPWFRPRTNRAVEIEPAQAPAFMFNRSGYVREAALKAINQLPDTPFFLAALVWRLNDWVGPVRRAAQDCANRELPRLSIRTIVATAPFLLERMPHWGRWGSPPAIILDALARPECVHGLEVHFLRSAEMSAGALRGAMRFGLLDHELWWISRRAMRPEFRATALKAIINGEVTWVTHYQRQWVDKVYGITRRVPVLARRTIPRPASLDTLIRQGAADRHPLVRRVAAHCLVQHAANLSNIKSLMALFDSDRSPSVRWNIKFLARRIP
jgi:hypothetical protein